MASKRLNMFRKNKTQETTENGALYKGCDIVQYPKCQQHRHTNGYTAKMCWSNTSSAFVSGGTNGRHPDDTDGSKYLETVNRVVIPACLQLVHQDFPDYKHRLNQLLTENAILFPNWSATIDIVYKRLTKDKLTDQNLTNMWILRACIDIMASSATLLDDISDGAGVRQERAAWHETCAGGAPAAVYDALLMISLPYYLVGKFMRHHQHYTSLITKIGQLSYTGCMGVSLEMFSTGADQRSQLSPEKVLYVNGQKLAPYFQMLPTFGMLMAGRSDEKSITAMESIFYQFGVMEQYWNDLNDYWKSMKNLGHSIGDIERGALTWMSAYAIQTLDEDRRKIFKECYGSSDSGKCARIRQIYNHMNIPKLYMEFLKRKDKELNEIIATMDDPKLRQICFDYKQWLIGGLESKQVNAICK
ncbi:hypothetical protein AAG570_000814 [Ranatra chinensis]|uniref:Uncharacterized protein n=1 Tax=Ranatra chinensis TaxID=642074 RepID=A0ABD0YYU2_9HEMI